MGKIVAIGGGEIREKSTLAIDKYIVSISEKNRPKLLFIPTASGDAEGYIESVEKYFGELGCEVNALCLTNDDMTKNIAYEKITNSDIIYVGGGNTTYMINMWRKFDVDKYLKIAFEKGIILSGLSAGSICWFIGGHSDSELIANGGVGEYKFVNGLGFIPYYHCPHYNESERKSFDTMINEKDFPGIALENNTALAYIDGTYQLIKSDENAKAYLFDGENNSRKIEIIMNSKL